MVKNFVAFLLTITFIVACIPNLYVFAEESIYNLEYNYVYNESLNSWVTSGGTYKNEYLYYNCYGFVIDSKSIYHPGDFTLFLYKRGQRYPVTQYADLEDLVNLVCEDLEILGYCNIQSMRYDEVVMSDLISSLTVFDHLICVRINDWTANNDNRDFHFMKYDVETDAWYHKPGNSAILKYRYYPTEEMPWYPEQSFNMAELMGEDIYIYNSDIYLIKYSENVYNPFGSGTITKNIYCDFPVSFFIDAETYYSYNYSVEVLNPNAGTTSYYLQCDLCDVNGNIIANTPIGMTTTFSGTFTVTSSDNVGIYCLSISIHCNQPSGEGCLVSIGVERECPVHNYTYQYLNGRLHIGTCHCGATTKETHFVSRFDIVDGRYAPCLGCGVTLDLNKDNAFIGMSVATMVTANGSYILSNGIVVLDDSDIAAYLEGTLVFYDKNQEFEMI